MNEYHDGKWLVYTVPVGGGVVVGSCWVGKSPVTGSTVLYEADSYEEAQQYIADVRDLVIKPVWPRSSSDIEGQQSSR